MEGDRVRVVKETMVKGFNALGMSGTVVDVRLQLDDGPIRVAVSVVGSR